MLQHYSTRNTRTFTSHSLQSEHDSEEEDIASSEEEYMQSSEEEFSDTIPYTQYHPRLFLQSDKQAKKKKKKKKKKGCMTTMVRS